MTGKSALTLLGSIALLTAVACGGAPVPAKSQSPERRDTESVADFAASEPRTIEEAQDQISRARASLEPRSKLQAEPSAPRAEKAPSSGADAREEKPVDTCGGPCRAFASMKRAVDALCRMTGETDTRCVDAKRTLDDSSQRVAPCKCSGRRE